MRKEHKTERGCLTLDFLAGLGQERDVPGLAGMEDRPQGFWWWHCCVTVTKACAALPWTRRNVVPSC